jgi:hypothetical protein
MLSIARSTEFACNPPGVAVLVPRRIGPYHTMVLTASSARVYYAPPTLRRGTTGFSELNTSAFRVLITHHKKDDATPILRRPTSR